MENKIEIYQTKECETDIEVQAEICQTTPQNITIHLKNIFEAKTPCNNCLESQNKG